MTVPWWCRLARSLLLLAGQIALDDSVALQEAMLEVWAFESTLGDPGDLHDNVPGIDLKVVFPFFSKGSIYINETLLGKTDG